MVLVQLNVLLVHHAQGADRLPAALDRHPDVGVQPVRLHVRIARRIGRVLQVAHEGRHILALADDVGADMSVGPILRLETGRRLPLPDRAEQVLVQPVVQGADPAEQAAAQRHQTVDVRLGVGAEFQQALRECPQPLLGRLPLGDIHETLEQLVPPAQPDAPDRLENGEAAAVGAKHFALHVIHRVAQIAHRAGALLGRTQELVAPVPDDGFRRRAEQLGCVFVHPLDHARHRIHDDHAHRQVQQQLALEGFGFPQFIPPPVFLGHIPEDKHRADDGLGGVMDGCAGVGNLVFRAVPGDQNRVVDQVHIHAFGQRLDCRIRRGFAGLGVDDVEDFVQGAPRRLGGGPAGERLGRAVQGRHRPVAVAGDHPVADGAQGRRKLLLAGHQFPPRLGHRLQQQVDIARHAGQLVRPRPGDGLGEVRRAGDPVDTPAQALQFGQHQFAHQHEHAQDDEYARYGEQDRDEGGGPDGFPVDVAGHADLDEQCRLAAEIRHQAVGRQRLVVTNPHRIPRLASEIAYDPGLLRDIVQPVGAKQGQVHFQGRGQLLDLVPVEHLPHGDMPPRRPLLLACENRCEGHKQRGVPLQHDSRLRAIRALGGGQKG